MSVGQMSLLQMPTDNLPTDIWPTDIWPTDIWPLLTNCTAYFIILEINATLNELLLTHEGAFSEFITHI